MMEGLPVWGQQGDLGPRFDIMPLQWNLRLRYNLRAALPTDRDNPLFSKVPLNRGEIGPNAFTYEWNHF